MAKHAFIDESGTMPDQEIMTVALVIVDGVRTAEKLHPKLARSVFPPPRVRGLRELERWYADQKLHYAEMNHEQKLAMGAELSKANITAIIGYCRHSEESTTHEHRFVMYTELLKLTIRKALETIDDLVVSIGKQGGWESYGSDLIRELRLLPEHYTRAGNFRKGDFFLSSPFKPGQQISDFYASASWNFLLAKSDAEKCAPYERIRHQVTHLEEFDAAKELIKEK
jgi:hypothetical protein